MNNKNKIVYSTAWHVESAKKNIKWRHIIWLHLWLHSQLFTFEVNSQYRNVKKTIIWVITFKLTMSGQPVQDSDINCSSESDQILLQQFLESSATDHLGEPGILRTFWTNKRQLAPTGAQEMLIFNPYHRPLMGQVFFSILDSLSGERAEGGDMSHLKVVIWVI